MISSKFKFISEFLLAIALLLLSSFFIYVIYPQIPNYNSITSLSGLNKLSEKEVFLDLNELDLNEKAFWEINPIEINKQLVEKNPLIKEIKFRRFIFPKKQIRVYVSEKQAWASYGHKIIEDNGMFMADLSWNISKNLNPLTRKNLQSLKKNLVRIRSYSSLKPEDLIRIRYIVQILEDATRDKIIKINSDRERNFTMYTDTYKIKIGPLTKQVFEKVKRINLIAPQIEKLQSKSKESPLDYVDLSLATQEVILGQKKS